MYRQRHKQRMTILTTAAVLVPFLAACGNEEPPVTGVRWSIDSLTVDGTTHRAPDGAHLTLDGDGRAEGSYGCNTFGAGAAVDGDRITLSDTASTEMACDDKPMDAERALSRTLADGALRSEVDDDRLTLTTGSGDTVRLSRAGDAPLYGTRWTLTTPAVDGRAHLTFDKEGTVSGRLGCNHVNADATVRDGHITLGVPSLTRMMCEDSLMDDERALTKLFDGTADYRIEGRTLTLTSENGTSVRAVAER
ncbi:META domain-containing protein [Streptomyces sp. NPDC000348]|uniref:META domain-containing protein n=1 Tax=Streptomyces sp. NPDC000348 TaxID=3364538 RepID=UPI003693B457